MFFTDSIEKYICRHGLMRHDGFYILALSGGADSVALLCALHSLGYRIEAAHCNFRLRGKESDRDENFCIQLCNKLGIKLHRIHFETGTYASLHKVSVEMAARELRYRYFEQLRSDIHADGICVAHHKDDQVETVLLNIVRGTGLTGLQGMKPKNGNVLRPMLAVNRRQVTAYLDEIHQDYVTDGTNLEANVKRNRLRLNIIPELEKLNPSLQDNIIRMTEHLADATQIIDDTVNWNLRDIRLKDGGYSLDKLQTLHSPKYVLWKLLSSCSFNRVQIEEIADNQHDGNKWLSATHVTFIEQRRLYIVPKSEWNAVLPEMKIPEKGTYIYRYNAGDESRELRLKVSLCAVDAAFTINKSPLCAQFNAANIRFPLVVRPCKHCDRFVPFGMYGSKLVSDFMKDCKLPLMERRRQLVLTDAKGNILWVIGHRADGRHAIQSATKTVLSVELA